MKTATPSIREIASWFNMVPVEGEPGVYIIRSSVPADLPEGEMTKEDWDKFEKDINDACEQIDDPVEPL